jgi:H+/Cl- antiporter ClcA
LSESQFRKSFSEQFHLLFELGRWIPVSALVGLMAGSASALLLVSLNYGTYLRERHTWLVLLLAPAGWLIGLLCQQVGSRVEGGNNLILEETHDPTSTIPVRMTPLVLIGTCGFQANHSIGYCTSRVDTSAKPPSSFDPGRNQLAKW